jgi:hypothetical protein
MMTGRRILAGWGGSPALGNPSERSMTTSQTLIEKINTLPADRIAEPDQMNLRDAISQIIG